MVTHLGAQRIYENIKLGCAKNETEDGELFLTFTDVDNEILHLVPLSLSKVEQYLNLVRQTAAGQKIEVATQMPRGPQA